MKRIRIALLALFLALLLPAGVLAWRALEGLSLERAVRHQVVAERAFDEMERALSGFLELEEGRPFGQYRFYLPESGMRSPLARGDAPPFVVGAFQIDPDGSVHTPLRPRDLRAARARGDWPPEPEVEERIAWVTAIAKDSWERPAKPASEDADAQPLPGEKRAKARQDPGTTRALDGPLVGKVDPLQEAAEAEPEQSAYQVLQRFNRGADERAVRKQKIAVLESAPRAAESLADAEVPSAAAGGRRRERDALAASRPPSSPSMARAATAAPVPQADPTQAPAESTRALAESNPAMAEPTRTPAEPTRVQAEGALAPVYRSEQGLAASIESFDAAAPVRVALDPMVGRAVGDAHLVLSRTVLVGEQGVRQGLVLDRAALGEWLAAQALGPSDLSEIASVQFVGGDGVGGDGRAPVTPGASFVFEHRFAEPFDALTARLGLAALPGVGSPGAIYGLVALLFAVGAAGLFAIHRMVSVVVDFAERRSNFVSAVTHELKTPLTAIRMYGEMLRDGLVSSDEKRAEYYGTITDESERLSRLIDNVLEFSRLDRGRREMSLWVGPVRPVLEEAAQKLRAHTTREGFLLELAVEEDLPAIRFDRDALLQVIFNLVDNAMKYAGAGGVRRVVLQAAAREGGVEISVRDFGPGVSAGHLARIFEPFYRGEDELTRDTKGTGIGLALVKELSERMGAAVRGANVEDGGFRVSLAFAAAEGA